MLVVSSTMYFGVRSLHQRISTKTKQTYWQQSRQNDHEMQTTLRNDDFLAWSGTNASSRRESKPMLSNSMIVSDT